MRRSLQEETKMLKLLYFVLTARRKCSYIRFGELELTKKVKPIVVSMGNYAASGGYYIA
jgi:protease-4